MNTDTDVQASLDGILDSQLDDLADLPEFLVFPAGAHKVTITLESKEVNKHPSIECKMKVVETLELANPTDTPMVAGTESSVLYMLDNEFGVGKFKELMKPLAAHFGGTSVRETMASAQGAEVVVVTTVRTNKATKVSYTDIKSLSVV